MEINMIYTIKNEKITAKINSQGAELWSLTDATGFEYLWQADPTYWNEKSPALFPYIGRMPEKKYEYQGKFYEMSIHGFAKASEFQVVEQSEESITFLLEPSQGTMIQYPFSFSFFITFTVEGNVVKTKYTVENKSDETMYFGVGGHPGFNLPMEEGLAFEDYELVFENPCKPNRINFSTACFVSGESAYNMKEDKIIPMDHDMFDEDAIVLKDADTCVSLQSKKGSKKVTVRYPQMDYIGFWHRPKTDAPYVCIEPWSSLPANDGGIVDLEKQDNLISLESGKTYVNQWEIEL